ncbi:MAG: hypothetical protein CVU61_15710 [Deltaproteobacteria bacterium HGW-Deltaproteobacteria-19]|jgi:glycosyltransferase involved in cell wall biosynthesis|nr:MAG: hypothetical protein CVU61_15710 [Deltaproteobacteria bacterium HGW-Deltaproteobacteria-19]
MVIVQPYLFWRGHFRRYFENLLSDRYSYLYCDEQDRRYTNATWLKSLPIDYDRDILRFLLARLLHSLKTISHLTNRDGAGKPQSIHFIEFEPFSFMLFELLTPFRKKKILITLHSIGRMVYRSPAKDLASRLQRWVYVRAIRHAGRRGYRFVVHSRAHGHQLCRTAGAVRVDVIEYPCSYPALENPRPLKGMKLLIFGHMREDKGIHEFLEDQKSNAYSITMAGRIHDPRLRALQKKGLQVIDRFLAEEELKALIDDHDYVLLPYAKHYPGGAGPLKDALSFGKPVICSDIDIFREVVETHGVGFVYRDISEIASFLEKTTPAQYTEMAENCLAYAREHDWHSMRKQYFCIYNDL